MKTNDFIDKMLIYCGYEEGQMEENKITLFSI